MCSYLAGHRVQGSLTLNYCRMDFSGQAKDAKFQRKTDEVRINEDSQGKSLQASVL